MKSTTLDKIQILSQGYHIALEDVLLIALNTYGLNNIRTNNRMRFYLQLKSKPEKYFRFILSTNREKSPFSVMGDQLYIADKNNIRHPIGEVWGWTEDSAVIGYFRNNKRSITLNSFSRSFCTGCAFCPNSLENANDPPKINVQNLTNALRVLANNGEMTDFSQVEEVTISTGCFGSEDKTINHVYMVSKALKNLNYRGQLGILSSEIRSRSGFEQLAQRINDFHLVLTIECFENREVILKKEKASLSPRSMKLILKNAKECGHDTDLTYIVGLDQMDQSIPLIKDLVPYLTRMPNFQVYQPHNHLMDNFLAAGADQLEYFLKFRVAIENLFKPTGLLPQQWENYRPLWYYEFAGIPLSDSEIAIKKSNRITRISHHESNTECHSRKDRKTAMVS